MNYCADGYVMEQLIVAAVKHRTATVTVDLLSGAHQPVFRSRSVLSAFKAYTDGFPVLVHSSGSDIKFVKSATMTLSGLNRPLQTHWRPAGFHYRVTCAVEIISDANRTYLTSLEEMWPGPPPRPRLFFKRRAA
jgi:hypothetical protein